MLLNTRHPRGGRRRGRRAWPINAPRTTSVEGADGAAGPGQSTHHEPPVWRAPEGPEGTGGLRGAAPNEVRPPSLAGGRALRRPEHPWDYKQQHERTIGSRAGRRPRHSPAPTPDGTRNTGGTASRNPSNAASKNTCAAASKNLDDTKKPGGEPAPPGLYARLTFP